MPRLSCLKPGTRFRVPELDLTATLLMVNECRARVRIDNGATLVEFTNPDGETRTFNARRIKETSWSSAMWVEVLSFQPLPERQTTMAKKNRKSDDTASTTTATSTAVATPAKRGRTKKAEVAAAAGTTTDTPGTMSQLDAAARVLQDAGGTMNAKQMVEAMAASGYWQSPGGKTPHATLYSAILRELQTKGENARFVKTERGQFALRNA